MTEGIDYDVLAADYAAHRKHQPLLVGLLAAGAEVAGSSSALEVGSGTGDYAIALAALTGAACTGVDASAAMVAVSSARSPTVEFVHGRAEALPFADERFDFAFSVDVIHHLADRAAFFREAHRVLRPGGRLCTVTEDEAMIRERPLSHYFPETVAVELARYPPAAVLRADMRSAGFARVAARRERWSLAVDGADDCRAKVYSSLLLISDEAFARGLARLERDLARGPITVPAQALLLWAKAVTHR